MRVVDASVWVSLFVLEDVNHLPSLAWYKSYTTQDGRFVLPALALTEVAGAIARRMGRPRMGKRVVQQLLETPHITIMPISQELAMSSAYIAADLRLRGADAVYVAVANQLGAPLITWDKEQMERSADHITAWSPLDDLEVRD